MKFLNCVLGYKLGCQVCSHICKIHFRLKPVNLSDFFHKFARQLPSILVEVAEIQCTMLQKLSKCEVKDWLCWKIILLPLQFYVKSNFGQFKQSKNVIFGNFRDSVLWIFGKFGTWKLLKLMISITCKIGVAVKWSKLNKVNP